MEHKSDHLVQIPRPQAEPLIPISWRWGWESDPTALQVTFDSKDKNQLTKHNTALQAKF